jgi:hypothetical protein
MLFGREGHIAVSGGVIKVEIERERERARLVCYGNSL